MIDPKDLRTDELEKDWQRKLKLASRIYKKMLKAKAEWEKARLEHEQTKREEEIAYDRMFDK